MRQSFVTIAQSSQYLLNGNMQTHTHTNTYTDTPQSEHTHAKTSIMNIPRHE